MSLNIALTCAVSRCLRPIVLVVLALVMSATIQRGLAGWDGAPFPPWPPPPLIPEVPAVEGRLVYSTNEASATVVGIAGAVASSIEIPRRYNGLPVTGIGPFAFASTSVTKVTIPGSITWIDHGAFSNCVSLAGVYFEGGPPLLGTRVFFNCPATIYYLPGTASWGSGWGERQTMQWSLPAPVILKSSIGLDDQASRYEFNISWAANTPVVVEACSDLALPVWEAIGTNVLVDGWSRFSDPDRGAQRMRFYRLRSQ